jgi:FkbM family methyltransferase
LSLFSRYLATETPIILEIGANDGKTTNEFLTEFPGARIYAFEPDARAIAKWSANVTSSRAQLFETAIGAVDGAAQFWVSGGTPPAGGYPDGWDQSGSLRRPKTHAQFWPWVTFDKTTSVPVVRLDTWSRANYTGPIDLIFADVQGAEADLIAGGRETLSRTRFLYTEFSNSEWYEGQPTLTEIQAMIRDIGFRIIGIFGMNVLFGKL